MTTGETILKLTCESSCSQGPAEIYRIIRTKGSSYLGQYTKGSGFLEEASTAHRVENEIEAQSVKALFDDFKTMIIPVFSDPVVIDSGVYYELEIRGAFGKSLFRWPSSLTAESPWLPLEIIVGKIIAIVPDTPQPLPLFAAAARKLEGNAADKAPSACDEPETPVENADNGATGRKPQCEPQNPAEAKLLPLEQLQEGLAQDEIYFNAPEQCDVCKTTLTDKRFMVDGNFKPGGCLWGCMCAKCFLKVGEGIGWGKGQLYTKLENGEWLMTAGFRPAD